ncbi:MAG: TlpA family protein disulfide reductase [Aquabacterium sp.]|nr:TlpA family protein disulfide reductase [Ferruginibacter sp.]
MRLFLFFFSALTITIAHAQQGNWQAQLHREDGNNIVFTFEWKTENSKQVWYIKNAAEKLRVSNIVASGDSFFVQMPVFESQFRFIYRNGNLSGLWIKKGAVKSQLLPFSASKGVERFTVNGKAQKNISGRWAVNFSGAGPGEISVGEFLQKGSMVTGTILNASGDYRYLEGIVTKDSLLLSAFDGGHAFIFKAHINSDSSITDGHFFSGAAGKETWAAIKNNNAKVLKETVVMHVRPGEERLDFSFKDIDGKQVSINDNRFKNKVVIVQLMGSWCPNCMDETAFLSDYYNNNKQRGVEIIALAYEYTTDWDRSIKSLKKIQQNFNVQYPILNTEVAVTDSLRTQKTLPQLTDIKSYPSLIIIDKKGKVRKLETNFNGPATGEHYAMYKKEFEATVNDLLNEN